MAQRRKPTVIRDYNFEEILKRIHRVSVDKACPFMHDEDDTCHKERMTIHFKQIRGYGRKPARPHLTLTKHSDNKLCTDESDGIWAEFHADVKSRKRKHIYRRLHLDILEIPESAWSNFEDYWQHTTKHNLLQGEELWKEITEQFLSWVDYKEWPGKWRPKTTNSGGTIAIKSFQNLDALKALDALLNLETRELMTFRLDNQRDSIRISVQDRKMNQISRNTVALMNLIDGMMVENQQTYKLENQKSIESK